MALPAKIPRVLHVYWEGRLPFLRLMTLASFRRVHPEVQIRLYMAEPGPPMRWATGEQSVAYTGPDYHEAIGACVDAVVPVDWTVRYGHAELPASVRADLLRIALLSEVGGLWSDMDVLWLRPLDLVTMRHVRYPAGAREEDLVLATVFENGATGALMAAPGTAYFREVRRIAESKVHEGGYQSAGPEAFLACGGPQHVAQRFPELVFADLAPETFYPIAWNATHQLIDETVALPDATVGLHWFGGSPPIERFLNAYPTPESLQRVENTLTAALRTLALL